LLLQFRSSELLDLEWDHTPTHTTNHPALSFGAAAAACAADGDADAHGDIGGAGGCAGGADGGDSSDSEWGEFASFDEATPSKRGGRRRHQQQHLHRHASSYKVAGVNMFGFFSEYEVSSQVTSLMSVLKAAADTVSKSNSGESCAAVVPSSCWRS
jgi:hypothetical protein